MEVGVHSNLLGFIAGIGVVAVLFALYKAKSIMAKSTGNKAMTKLSETIHSGAMTFLKREYRTLTIFVAITAFVLAIVVQDAEPMRLLFWNVHKRGVITAVNFIFGAILSVLAGNIGMRIATRANVRTTEATRKSLGSGLRIAFDSGLVMGMGTVGIGLLGVIIMFVIFGDPEIIYGFGLGASSVAFFARVGGGIYTKAADVGADMVGKVETSLPEDDPRNPAVVADLVGDNVGDVAGMGADLFESYVDSLIAAMVLGLVTFGAWNMGAEGILYPMLVAAVGIVISIIGSMFVKLDGKEVYQAIDKGTKVSGVLMVIALWFVTKYYLSGMGDIGGNFWLDPDPTTRVFLSAIIGLITGIIIGFSVEFMTSSEMRPAHMVAKASQTGAATNIITGTSVGMMATVIPAITIAFATLLVYQLSGLFGITIAAVGMLSILGVSLAADAYGPVVDNAAGIAQMTKLGKDVREKTELLDAVGNTTAAASKGLQLGASALTVLALFASFIELANLEVINLGDPGVIAGLLIGGMLPFLFSALIIQGVGKAAYRMVEEVRRQFKEKKGILTGKTKPDYTKCIHISADTAIKYMVLPGTLAITIPIFVGLAFGIQALGGLIIGNIVTGVMLSLYLSTSGGAWDNAKKFIEEGHYGGKGSAAHKASVVGDTVGDPFKDAAGPSLDILIKLVSMTALIFLPIFL